MGIFNKETFLQTRTEKALSTVRQTLDPDIYEVVITEVDIANGETNGREWARLNTVLTITDHTVLSKLGREKYTLRYDLFLDINQVGSLDDAEGKNVALGKLFKATGLNHGGSSILDLVGRRCLASVVKVPVKDSPDGDMKNEVRGVAALS